MSQTYTSQRRARGASELKMLIAAVSLAAVLAGWAGFSAQERASASSTAPTSVVNPVDPTLRVVSLPAQQPQPVTVTRSSR